MRECIEVTDADIKQHNPSARILKEPALYYDDTNRNDWMECSMKHGKHPHELGIKLEVAKHDNGYDYV